MDETTITDHNHSAKLKTLWNAEEVQRRVSEMANDIGRTIDNRRLVCLIVLTGGFYFGADLTRHLAEFADLRIEFIRLRSYSGKESTGEVEVLGTLPDVDGEHVLVIEDLMDTGLTLAHLDKLLKLSGALSVKYAVLVDKPVRRRNDFRPDFIGFHCDADAYLVGYGMDIRGAMRELRHIAALEAQ
jgi:hypoxanthine phosphoribosyltransferase